MLRRVNGDSMLPGLKHGQIVIAIKTHRSRIGDTVIIRHDGLEKIKRVAKISRGEIYVLGDNSSYSTDSRTMGWLPRSVLTAKVIWPKR